ncbi:glycosyltransferase family 39 protein [Candidatus Daviesbacteria bacterium]|nr:glycosyltransferase family 39 protein [Candidatus Daviesbacteria bacterium]
MDKITLLKLYRSFWKTSNKILVNNFFRVSLFTLLLIFTFIIRAHNYDKTPGIGHLEEMLFGWSGIYLIETGTPVSWSTLDYPKWAKVFTGKKSLLGGPPEASVDLYQPWLDEPPLFSLLVGYSAHKFGANRNDIIPSSYLRFPVIFIATLTSIMIFLIARLVSGYWTGILSLLIYGITPIMVFSSRLAVPENLIALLFATSVYLLLKYQIKPKFLYLIPIPIMAGIAGLSKPTGYFITPLAIYFAYLKKNYKSIVYLILATIPFVAVFIWYGFYYNAEIFMRIASIQGNRPAGFSALGYLFSTPGYDIFTFYDGWYIFCLLSAVVFLFFPKNGNQRFISLAFIYWIILVLLSGGEQDLLPWYRIPAFPMLAILGAWGIQLLFEKVTFFKTVLAAGLLLGNRYYLVNAFRPNIHAPEFRLIFSALTLPSLFYSVHPKLWLERLTKLILIGIIAVGIYMNSVYIYNQYELVCENQTCPFGPLTFLSEVHFPFIWRFFVLGEPTYR